LSRSCLDRDSRSRHWQRAGLDSRDFLDSLKNRSGQFKKQSLDMAYALKSRFLSRSQPRLLISTLLKVDLDRRDKSLEVGHRTRCYVKSPIHRYLTVPCSLTNVTFPVSCSDYSRVPRARAHAIKYQAHLLSTYFLGFHNYRGEVTNNNINLYHGD
jgi:hypothetical protein